jgi:hypothetical protein
MLSLSLSLSLISESFFVQIYSMFWAKIRSACDHSTSSIHSIFNKYMLGHLVRRSPLLCFLLKMIIPSFHLILKRYHQPSFWRTMIVVPRRTEHTTMTFSRKGGNSFLGQRFHWASSSATNSQRDDLLVGDRHRCCCIRWPMLSNLTWSVFKRNTLGHLQGSIETLSRRSQCKHECSTNAHTTVSIG